MVTPHDALHSHRCAVRAILLQVLTSYLEVRLHQRPSWFEAYVSEYA